jgi:hypothetical protein
MNRHPGDTITEVPMSIFKYTLPLASLAFAGAVHAATGTVADYGAVIAAQAGTRTVDITSHTRFIHVTNGETLTFRLGGRSLTWHVDTFPNIHAFRLSAIMPAATAMGDVWVHVAAAEQYRNG